MPGIHAHEWPLVIAGVIVGAVWSYAAVAFTYESPLVPSLAGSPVGWIGLALLWPALAIFSLASWTYERGIAVNPVALGALIALGWGSVLAAIAIVGLRRLGA